MKTVTEVLAADAAEKVTETPASVEPTTETQTAPSAPMIIGIRKAKFQPPRIVLNAVEGWGKTSAAAYTPKPLLLMANGETGYDTLLGVGLVPEIAADVIDNWKDLIALLEKLDAAESLPYKTIILDAMGGFEKMCHTMVCKRDFKGDWGEKGFGAFQRGYGVAVPEWIQMLAKLDRIRTKGVMIILLSHVKIGTFKNPSGNDFDRYAADLDKSTWGITHKWADAVLFGKFVTITEKDKGRSKGIGGVDRILYTEYRDAYDAKNRYGMPDEIDIPNDPTKTWETIWKNIYKKPV